MEMDNSLAAAVATLNESYYENAAAPAKGVNVYPVAPKEAVKLFAADISVRVPINLNPEKGALYGLADRGGY